MLVTKSREVWRKCRLCMRSDVFLIFLFENSGELTNLAKAIKELLQYEVSRDDKYPSFVCCKCSDKLWEFKDFREKCDHTKNCYEAILSSRSKYAEVHSNTFLGKPSGMKEELSDLWIDTKLKQETSENYVKKYTSLTKQLCVKEEEELPECTMENYEVFMESVTAEVMEKSSEMDSDSEMHSLKPNNVASTKEETIVMGHLQCRDSEDNLQMVENETITQELEADDTEDIQLMLSDSDCEILEEDVVSALQGQHAMHEKMHKEKPHTHPTISDSDSDVQILDPIPETGARGLAVISMENPHCKQTETKKILKQRDHLLKDMSTSRRYGRRGEDVNEEQCSVECLAQSNIPSASRTEVNEKQNSNSICFSASTSSKTPRKNLFESTGKEIMLILRQELDDVNKEAHLNVKNGTLQWSFRGTGEPDAKNVVLHIKERGKMCVNEIRATEGDCVKISTNSVGGMGLRETSKGCLAAGDRGKNISGAKTCDLEQSHHCESFTYLSQCKAMDEHECNRCGKQFQNLEKLRRHKSMNRTIHCQYCNLSFRSDSDLFEHLPSHDGKVKWNCGDCGKKSVKWKDVWVHIQVHRKGHICNERFTTPKANCIQGNICKVCHKRLPNKSSLRIHLLSHSEENKWVCPHCEENFNKKENLMSHIETHNNTGNSSNSIK